MYSCVFGSEFTDLVVFWLLLCHPCHSLHKTKWRLPQEAEAAQKTVGGPDLVYSPETHQTADFFTATSQ